MKSHCFLYAMFGQILVYSQLYTIIKNRSAWDVSLTGFKVAFIFAFFFLIYGFIKKDTSLIIFNTFSGIGTLFVIIALFIYQ